MADVFDRCRDPRALRRFMNEPDYYVAREIISALSPVRNAGPWMEFQGRKMLQFSTNDYLGLSVHPEVLAVAKKYAKEYGIGAPMGARPLTGTTELHIELEEAVARFKRTAAACVFSTGANAMIGSILALVGPKDLVLHDQYAHASLVMGIRACGCEAKVFAHNDMAELERRLAEAPAEQARVVVVDGVYSMQGTMAPLREACAIAHRHGARIFVDDAHGTGVCGASGRGTAEHFGVEAEVDLHLGTFSKAVGTTGGFAAGEKAVVDYIRYLAPTMLFTKSAPAAVVAATTKAIEVIGREPGRREKLWRNARALQEGLRGRGIEVGPTQTPITPIRFAGMKALHVAYYLRRSYGIWVAPVIYPAVGPRNAILRAIPTASHSEKDVAYFIDAVEAVAAETTGAGASARRKAVIKKDLPFWKRWGIDVPAAPAKLPVTGQVEVRRVESGKDLDLFLHLPERLYQGDPCWVPPLAGALKDELDPKKNPFYEHAARELFLAYRGKEPVGRIAAIENRAHNEFCSERVVFFGYFEAVDDEAVSTRLVDAVRYWARPRSLEELRGPASPSLHGTCGVLVEGFDSPPVLMMPYNPPSYPRLLEATGLRKLKDMYGYLFTSELIAGGLDWSRLERAKRLIARKAGGEFRLRTIDMSRFEEEVKRLWDVFEEARRENWGYVPMTDAEFTKTVNDLKRAVDPRTIIVAEVKGEPVGCLIALPDLNPLLRKIKGELWPFGWITLLRERRKVKGLRVFALGTLKPYRHLGVTGALLLEFMRRGLEAGYTWAEASWVLEDNLASIQTIEKTASAERYKRYRLYAGAV